MKLLSLFFAILTFFSIGANAQVKQSQNQYLVDKGAFINPGFDQGYSGWTITGCTKSLEADIPFTGNSLKLTCTNETFSIKQETTAYATDQLDTFASCKIKTSAAGPKVRTLANGVGGTDFNLTGPSYEKFQERIITDSTSNGIEVYADANFTGTVYIEDCYVRPLPDGYYIDPIPSQLGNNGRLLKTNGSSLEFKDDNQEINYLTNSQAESTDNNWVSFKSSTTADYPENFGGTPDVGYNGVDRNIASPLRGSASWVLDLTMAVAGAATDHGAYQSFQIDSADLASMLRICVAYDFSDPLYNDGDIVMFIYDEDKSQFVRFNGEEIPGGKNNHYCPQFQTDATSDNYRIGYYYKGTSKDFALKFEIKSIGPKTVSYGSPKTNSVPFVMSIGSTGTAPTKGTFTESARWYRDGEYMIIDYTYYQTAAGTAGTGQYLFGVPGGYQIDTSKIRNVPGYGLDVVGSVEVYDDGSLYEGSVRIRAASGSNLVLTVGNSATPTSEVSSTLSGLDGTNVRYSFNARVPILGWSSNGLMSETTESRDIIAKSTISSLQSISSTTSFVIVDFDTVELDTSSMVNTASNLIKITESGYYDVISYVPVVNAASSNIEARIYDITNSTQLISDINLTDASGNSKILKPILLAKWFDKDTEIRIEVRSLVDGTYNVTASNAFFSVKKNQSPQTVYDTERVSALYRSNSGQSINTSSYTTVVYEDLVHDDTGSMNTSTGVYTLSKNGKFRATCRVSLTGLTGTMIMIGTIRHNGIVIDADLKPIGGAGTYTRLATATIDGSVNDTVDCQVYHDYGSSRTMYNQSQYNTFSIERIK